MKHPRRALVLAAGLGSRLDPITRSLPKPLLPLMGVPILRRNLRTLESWGVREALVNLHHAAESVFSTAMTWRFESLRLDFSFEPELLGTGGAVSRAHWFAGDETFWMLNSDIAFETRHGAMLAAMKPGTIAAVWLVRGLGPMTVESRRGSVSCFRSARPGSAGTGTLAGLHLIHPRILRYIPESGPSSIVTAYEAAIEAGERVRSVFIPGSEWSDIGTPESYLQAHAEAARAMARRPVSFASVSPGARVARTSTIRDSVVLPFATVHAHARLKTAIVGPGSHAYGKASGLVVRVNDLPEPFPLLAARTGWPRDRIMAVPFPARASDRRFVRFRHRNLSAIAVAHGGKRAENDLYVPHARFLMSVGVPVPRVLFDHPDRRAALLEDVGDCSLESMLPSLSRENRIAIYTAVLEAASLMHSAGTRAAVSRAVRLIDPFSPSLYMWEHELFLQRFLQPRVKPPPRVERAIMRELGEVSARLQKQPPVLVHRDLQSSNVHVRGRSVVLIDFQGMRMGAAIYDLASLLCDPYAMLPREDRERLLTVYAGLVGRPTGDIAALFPQAAVQRLVQALGAFGRMCEDRDTSRFSRYITPGLQMLEAMIRECGEMPALAAGVSQALESEQPGRKL